MNSTSSGYPRMLNNSDVALAVHDSNQESKACTTAYVLPNEGTTSSMSNTSFYSGENGTTPEETAASSIKLQPPRRLLLHPQLECRTFVWTGSSIPLLSAV